MSKDLIPEIEYCAFNLAIFLFCFTEVTDEYSTSIFKLNREYSFHDFIENLFQLKINLYRQSTKKLYYTPFLHLREHSPITIPIFLKFLFKK